MIEKCPPFRASIGCGEFPSRTAPVRGARRSCFAESSLASVARVVLGCVLVISCVTTAAFAQSQVPVTGELPSTATLPSAENPIRLERTVAPLPADAEVLIRDEPAARSREEAAGTTHESATPAADDAGQDSKPVQKERDFKPSLSANDFLGSTLENRDDARTFVLTVPAPRGMILDRNGIPLAQTKVVYYAAINFPTLSEASDAEVLIYAHKRMAEANQLAVGNWSLADDVILAHYHNRRWLPLTFSSVLSDEQADSLRAHQSKGLLLHPIYMRTYPHGSMASHIIGYVGNRSPRRTGEIESGEELWGDGIGIAGLEKTFNSQLTGRPGKINVLFDSDGTKLIEEMIVRPTPGQNVITTIDFEMQKLVERLLDENVRRGAMVVMDVETGDIVAMASNPQYNPNDFIPSISHERYAELQNDPSNPLFPRAFGAAYPPASTFKVPIALACLESGVVNMETVYSCPSSYYIGDTLMRNWNKDGEGYMNVVGALTRSCNTWFYQAAIATGAESIESVSSMLGFGRATGIPLPSEATGFVPTMEWAIKERGYRLTSGDLANMAIGQGSVLASPLQVAHGMAGIAAGDRLMQARLVMQVQDVSNRVTETFPPTTERNLLVDSYNIEIIAKGMEDVVNAGNGTGKAAAHSKIKIAGKTGTGQWKVTLEQNVAWFAGFAPAKHPVFSFAVLYEGQPGETVSGGKMGAPVIGEFFESFLTEDKLAELSTRSEGFEIASSESPDEDHPEVKSIYSGGGGGSGGGSGRSSGGGDQPAQPKPAAEPEKKQGFFRRLFSR